MSDIFISYASEDKSRVQALARALERKGWSVWWDRRIPAGKSFDEVIHEALKAARSVVVVWTNTSVKSTWVKNESRSGMRRGILFPVMLLGELEIPLEFEHLQAAHLMDWQSDQEHAGFDQFIDDLTGVIGPPVMQTQALPVSSAKPTPEPETGLLQGAVRAVLVSGNNNLSALTLSPGTLDPAFAASITDYTATVASDVTGVNVSATKADSNSVLSEDVPVGSGTATGQATIQLNGPGTVTPALLTVAAPNGNSKTYRIMVKRAAPSGNNNLSALTISPGSLSPAFSANILNYTVNVGNNVANVNVSAAKADSNAVLSGDLIAAAGTATGQATIQLNLAGVATHAVITITAPNGNSKTYRITVNRAASLSNNNLSTLNVSPGTLAQTFAASNTDYTVNVASGVTSVNVSATKSDPNAVISGDVSAGAGIATGQATIQLSGPGTTTGVTIWVTAPGGSQKTYTLNVSRAARVEPEPERWEPEPSAALTGTAMSDSPRESFRSQSATEFSGVDRKPAHASDARSSESAGTGQSSDSIPYVPIGIGLLAATRSNRSGGLFSALFTRPFTAIPVCHGNVKSSN